MRQSIALFSLSFLAFSFDAEAYAPGSSPKTNNVAATRSQFLQSVAAMAAGAVIAPSQSIAVVEDKQFNLPPNEIGAIVEKDLVENAFLTNGKLTRSIYDEKAIFTDEIDTYTLDKWMKGTARLFVGPPGSRVSMVGPIEASDQAVTFRFEEDLMFNIPFKPVVNLSGKVVLERDEKTGLITSYREFW
eukprot:CAMPEP_0194117950 /NCGR_PEP_ID=MMETSP0150-20130528/33517_1 /TAXON_ID=122233 /ORGANISM="Chaetoceros debilis, Strain MM31A-1" /LENGTH=187 /DNA_ID=CAMNT_0038809153 /DNA_START=62 /DNA_END=622 /DNA_ORIENTATION=-